MLQNTRKKMWFDEHEPENKRTRNDDSSLWFPESYLFEDDNEFLKRLNPEGDNPFGFDFGVEYPELHLSFEEEEDDEYEARFAERFPHLYSPSMTSDNDKRNRVCKSFGPNTGKTYWNFLYNYHVNLNKMTQWHTLTLVKNKPSRKLKDANIDAIKACAMYKDKIFCFGGTTGLLSRSFCTRQWGESSNFGPNQFGHIWECLLIIVEKVAKDPIVVRRHFSGNVTFRVRENYLFISAHNTEKQKHSSFVFGIRKANQQPFLIDNQTGLIGDVGCFYASKNNSKIKILTTEPFKTIEIQDTTIHVCYNTPSNCFLTQDRIIKKIGREWFKKNEFTWNVLTKEGIQIVLEDTVKTTEFNLELKYTLNETYWVWYREKTLFVLDKNGNLNTTKLPDKGGPPSIITDLCIADDYVYLFAVPGICIVNLKNLNDVKYYEFRENQFFDYIEVHPFGFLLGYDDPEISPKFLFGTGFEFVGCHICQTPSKLMCSECRTPACSDKHFKCCK